MKYHAIIFDFNGVLVWDTPLHAKSWKIFSEKIRGYPLNDEEIITHVLGVRNQEILEYLSGRPLDPQTVQAWIQEKESIYRQLCLNLAGGFTLSPGAVDLLEDLKALEIPRTIATASERSNVDFFIEHLNLARWFDLDKIVLDDGSLPGKPSPAVYQKACENLRMQPDMCVVIEDSIAGVQAANAAGIGYIIAMADDNQRRRMATMSGVKEVIANLSEVRRELFISTSIS